MKPITITIMKLKLISGIMLLVLGVFCLSACGDDEDEAEPQNKVNAQCVGSWTGWTHLTTNFINKDYTGDTFTLSLAQDGTLTAVYKDNTWGTATINGIIAAQAADGTFALTGGEGTFAMNNIRTGQVEEFACKLESATLSADKKTLEAYISAYMETGHGNMLFAFHTGEAPSK